MNGYQNLKRQLLPLIKGLPMVAIVFLGSLFIATKMIEYSPNVYQSMAKIKLDDQRFGKSGTNLYGNLDVFSSENVIETEAEVLKSSLIIGKVIDSLDFDVVIYRKGSIKNTMLYDNSPIKITYGFSDEFYIGRSYNLSITSDNSIKISYQIEDKTIQFSGSINENIKVGNGYIKVTKIESAMEKRGLELKGEYVFKIFSRDGLILDISSRLDISAIDKEIAVLRVVYKDEHPLKVSVLTNALCEAYIKDYVSTKTSAASQTLAFIDEKITEVSSKLINAESALEEFKKENKVVNTLQETETGLREISKLKIQLINLEMNEEAIIELKQYIDSGEYFDETAINFGFGDLLMTELVKKMKLWQDERQDLLLKYQPENEKILAVDLKIAEIRSYIKEGIKQNLNEIATKREEIATVVEESSHMFDELPTREKNQHILERDFRLMEEVYNFLSKKKIEATIASSANISFHRIIQRALTPKEPVSPNRTLIKFVAGLFGLILGIAVVYLMKYLRAKVNTREDLENGSLLPIAGIIRKKNTSTDFEMLAKSLLIKSIISKGNVLAIASTIQGEGKSYIAKHLSNAFQNEGFNSTYLHLSDLQINDIEKAKNEFEIIVLDTPANSADVRGIEGMKYADATLYIYKAGNTAINFIPQPDLLKEEYNLDNIHLVLNNVHKGTNYSGSFVGSRYHKNQKSSGIINRIKYYFKTYLR